MAPFRRSDDNGSSSGARLCCWLSWKGYGQVSSSWVSVAQSSGEPCVWWTCSPPFAAWPYCLPLIIVPSSLGVMSKSDRRVRRCCLELLRSATSLRYSQENILLAVNSAPIPYRGHGIALRITSKSYKRRADEWTRTADLLQLRVRCSIAEGTVLRRHLAFLCFRQYYSAEAFLCLRGMTHTEEC